MIGSHDGQGFRQEAKRLDEREGGKSIKSVEERRRGETESWGMGEEGTFSVLGQEEQAGIVRLAVGESGSQRNCPRLSGT